MYREQLEYFALAYRFQSFAVAAEHVPMSAQGLAKAIHALEVELGVVLFTLSERGHRLPTAYADELIVFVNHFATDYRRLQHALSRVRAQEGNIIRLGTSLGILGLFGPDFLNRFHAARSDIKVVYNELPDDLCEAGLREGVYDLAFTLAPYEERFVTTELYSSEICFWVHRKDPLSQKKSMALKDFEGRAVAIPGRDFKCYRNIILACEQIGIKIAQVVPSSEIFWIYEFVASGKGVGFSVRHLVELSIFKSRKDIAVLTLEGVTWSFGISYLPTHRLTSAEHQFYDYCINTVCSFMPKLL